MANNLEESASVERIRIAMTLCSDMLGAMIEKVLVSDGSLLVMLLECRV